MNVEHFNVLIAVIALMIAIYSFVLASRNAQRLSEIEEILSAEPSTPPAEDWRNQTMG